MTFSADRDLLVLEPSLFRDIAWTGQRRIDDGGASISGVTLTSPDSDFDAAHIAPGAVALLDSLAMEVVERLSATELLVSLLRDATDDPLIQPPQLQDASLVITSFGPQRAHVHAVILRALGIEPDDPDGSPSPADITNPAPLARLEALGALHLIFASAAALAGDNDRLWTKAALYRDRFIAQRSRVAVGVDLTGDGAPDAIRRLNTIQFIRS